MTEKTKESALRIILFIKLFSWISYVLLIAFGLCNDNISKVYACSLVLTTILFTYILTRKIK